MGWFQEQIAERIKQDDEYLHEAYAQMAREVFHKGAGRSNASIDTKNALDAILAYFQVRTQEVPGQIKTLDGQLSYLLQSSGVMFRSVKLDAGWRKNAVGPMLGFLEDGTLIALIPNLFSGYSFRDAVTGKRKRVTRKNEKLFRQEAICFYTPLPQKSLSVSELIRYIRRTISFPVVLMIGVCTLVISLVAMLMPELNQLLFSRVIEDGNLQILLALATFLGSVIVSQLLFSVVKNMLINCVETKMDIQVRAAMMARIFSLPASFFKRFSSGELASMSGYVSELCSSIVSVFYSIGFSSLFSLLYVVQIFQFASALVVPALVMVISIVALTVITSIVQRKMLRKVMEYTSKNRGMTYAMITGIRKIRVTGSEKRSFSRWLQVYTKEAAITHHPPLLIMLNGVLLSAITTVGGIVIYFMALRTNISVADYIAFNTAYGMFSSAFLALGNVAAVFARIKAIIDHIKPLLEACPEVSDKKHMMPALNGEIELDNVSFRYEDNLPMVLKNFSLRIASGEYVAIVGKTGCGKSTLVRLLLGFEKPALGAIYYDGVDMSMLDLKSLRKHIGVVIQNGKLFSGDIFSNITVSAPGATMEDAWWAAETAGIADDIRALPMNMFTLITEGSGGVSGGQRQRLMIARAVASRPSILIFDEATSALDNITQKRVTESLEQLNCTRVVIAHRLSTIEHCDRILVMDDGNIIEQGTYQELIDKNGYFAELVRRQRLED